MRALAASDARRRAIRLWLYAVAALIFAMVLVGGATRLTESGLSITEWQPITGTLPPLSENEWQAEFDKYKSIPQYTALNRGMTLSQFKTTRISLHLICFQPEPQAADPNAGCRLRK